MSSFLSLYKAANSLEAHTLKGSLEAEGIEVQLKGSDLGSALGELPASVLEVELLVAPGDIARANEILDQYKEQAGRDWICQNCQEHNSGSFEVCWNCGTDSRGGD